MREPASPVIRRLVGEAPADANRAARRAVGSDFRWRSPGEMGNAAQAPRSVRRHGQRMLFTASKDRTRRERREAARVVRAMNRRGL